MGTIEGWNEHYADFVRALAGDIASGVHATTHIFREVARRTGGLPVYGDIGGCLVLAPDGQVIGYDLNDEAVAPVTDPSWIRVACITAAEKYPALAGLKPVGDRLCDACAGTGRVLDGQARCGECNGGGWLAVTASDPPERG